MVFGGLVGGSRGDATRASGGLESGSDEEPAGERKKRRLQQAADKQNTPVRDCVAHGSGEEQHSTSDVIDMPLVLNDGRPTTSRVDNWVSTT